MEYIKTSENTAERIVRERVDLKMINQNIDVLKENIKNLQAQLAEAKAEKDAIIKLGVKEE